jgi:hypothetical protein
LTTGIAVARFTLLFARVLALSGLTALIALLTLLILAAILTLRLIAGLILI